MRKILLASLSDIPLTSLSDRKKDFNELEHFLTSYEWNVPDSCKYDFDEFFIIFHLARPQATCISNFKFLASQEVLFLLQVFAVSLKEAKGTFLTPAKMIATFCSSLIIKLCIKQPVYQISNS